MKTGYDNALQMMLKCDEELAGKINEFIEQFPPSFARRIDNGKKSTLVINDKKRWELNDNGASLGIMASSAKNDNKGYANLMLSNISYSDMLCWPRFEGEKLIGYFTLYLHDDEKKYDRPLPVNYDFYAKRIDKKICVTIRTRVNSAIKENGERLEKYGLSDLHKRVVNAIYEVDTKSIVQNTTKR